MNAQANYYSAPQQLDAEQVIIGHSHFVIEALQSMTQTTPLDNTKFAFFQGVNTPVDSKSQLNVNVTAGLPAGVYRLGSINAAANHQPVLVAVAEAELEPACGKARAGAVRAAPAMKNPSERTTDIASSRVSRASKTDGRAWWVLSL